MHIFACVAVFVSLSWGIVYPFEHLPYEIITKIMVLEPQSVCTLSATNKATRNALIEWAKSHDASFLTDTEKDYTRLHIGFILQHNKKIADAQVAEAATTFVYSLIEKEGICCYGRIEDEKEDFLKSRFKAIASISPWAVYRDYYHKTRLISYKEIEMFTRLGFLLPFIHVENKPIPLMHYLVKKELPHLVVSKCYGTNCFALLLQQGMNPFFMHEKKTILDLLKEGPQLLGPYSVAYKDDLREDCLCNDHQPNDPYVVMYYKSKLLTVASIEACVRDE